MYEGVVIVCMACFLDMGRTIKGFLLQVAY